MIFKKISRQYFELPRDSKTNDTFEGRRLDVKMSVSSSY